MATNFPTSFDVYATLVDNVDDILAAYLNDPRDAIETLEAKVGVNSSAVTTSHDYKFTHLPGQVQNWDLGSYEMRAQTFQSDVATGTAPLIVASTTVVTNLNADKVDGYDFATIQSTILAAIYPVGSLYFNATVATNPATLLGFGTWAAFGAGRVPVGLNAADADFNTVEETGGAKTVNLAHDHGGWTGGLSFNTIDGSNSAGAADTKHRHDIVSGLSATQSIVQPYIVVYMWKRTA